METQTAPSKNFFEYDDPLAWLRDLIEDRKRRGLPCSYRWLSQQAGYSSPNFFKLVLDGRRALTDESVRHLVRIFKLGREEADYFKTLVQFHKAKDALERVVWADRLLQARPKSEAQRLSLEQFDYYSKWWFVIVREALLMQKGIRTAADLEARFDWDLGHGQIEEALAKLESIGLIRHGSDGCWEPTTRTLQSGDRVVNASVFGFHQQVLELARKALLKYKAHQREFHTLTLQMTPAKYARVREALLRFKKEVLDITDAGTESDSVYQLNLQLFPIALAKRGNS